MSKEQTRIAEEYRARLFSVKKPFSEHLFKWEDNNLPDKYYHNCFEYTAQPTKEEFKQALEYQKSRGDSFIVLEGDFELADSFGLEADATLTMELKGSTENWKKNDKVHFAVPSIEELEKIELKHYASVYGESFTKRNARRLYEKMSYHGAYINDVLAAACYSYTFENMTCIDGLIVDEDFRHQYIATTLLAHVANENEGNIIFLHADSEDTPKDMYLKLGFEITDYLYGYISTDINSIK